MKGADDIGYGLRPEHPLEVKAAERRAIPRDRSRSTSSITPRSSRTTRSKRSSELTGVPSAACCSSSRSSTPIRRRKVMSLWTMGFNQHVRGVWANQLVYNLHLLTGKISEPGN